MQAVLGCGACGILFAVKCTHVDFPFPDKVLRATKGVGGAGFPRRAGMCAAVQQLALGPRRLSAYPPPPACVTCPPSYTL